MHPRSDWTSTPAANAHPFDPSKVEGVAVHWNGPAVPQSALTDPRSYLEGVRRYHVNTPGWSDIAYNLAADQTGDAWDLRGLAHMSGANGDTDANTRFVAVLAILGQGQEPTEAMLDGIRFAVGMTREKYPHAQAVKTHNQVRPAATACPGPHLTRAVNAGVLQPRQPKEWTDMATRAELREVIDAALASDAFKNSVRLSIEAERQEVVDAVTADITAKLANSGTTLSTSLRNNVRFAVDAELTERNLGG